MRVVVAGDVHGNDAHLRMLLDVCVVEGAPFLVVCGDFGFWPHMDWGREFIEIAQLEAHSRDVCVIWIDGNHDNHDVLESMLQPYKEMECGPGFDGLVPIGDSGTLMWCPRGWTFQLDELTCMGFGGGISVDREHRREGESWWSGEAITREQVDDVRAVIAPAGVPYTRAGFVDVVFSHEAPLANGMFAPAKGGVDDLSYKDVIPESLDQRRLISELVDVVKPERVFCGHHHVRRTFTRRYEGGAELVFPECRVDVLGHDHSGADSYTILECGDL